MNLTQVLVVVLLLGGGAASANVYPGMPDGTGSYQEFIETYDDFLNWLDADNTRKDFNPAAIEERRKAIGDFHARLDTLAVRDWARDPGFYVDQMLYLAFTELPQNGDGLQKLQDRLATIPTLATAAIGNLDDVAADYADLAIFNLSNADGVGHGFPYRATPPEGILGWYEDLLDRAEDQQPELRDDIVTAMNAIEAFNAWLLDNRKDMTGLAGVGRDNFDWYLKHVKLMPFTTDEIVVLGERGAVPAANRYCRQEDSRLPRRREHHHDPRLYWRTGH